MNRFFISLISVLISVPSFADHEFALLAGFRSGSTETDLRNASTETKTGFAAGGIFNLGLMDPWVLRTGFIISGRPASLGPTVQGKVDLNFYYVDVPATVMLRFSEAAGVFAGPVIAFNQSKETTCSIATNCGAQNVKSVIVPWQMGLQFKLMPQLGGEVFYEYIPGSLADNVAEMKTVGINALIFFE